MQIIQVSAASNSASIGKPITLTNVKLYPINFEYLDNKDYIIVQIVHNGDDSEMFIVVGKVKGVKEIKWTIPYQIMPSFKYMHYFGPIFPILLFQNRTFMKYGGSFILFFAGAFGIGTLINGKTDWWVWLLTAVSFLFSATNYFIHRHIPPVKI